MRVPRYFFMNQSFPRHSPTKECDFTDGGKRCPKCGAYSGDDWSQCVGDCPMVMSPHYHDKQGGSKS